MTAAAETTSSRRTGGPAAALRPFATAPFTSGYVVVLLATTLLLRLVSARDADRLLDASSTDVAHLTHDPIRVLLTSALWLPGRTWLPYAVVLVLVLAPIERRFGVIRAIQVFLSGHVLATLLTELPIGAAITMHLLDPTAAHRLDVGVSYGAYAAVGAFAGSLPRRRRLLVLAVALVSIVGPELTDPGMTLYGHLLSLGIGTCWWRVLYGHFAGAAPSGAAPRPPDACQVTPEG